MSGNTDDVDDEYLDDPISLMAIVEIKKEICDEDLIIDIKTSSDEEETYTSSYGKKNFVLPVTFFDNTRNIRLLNKCKPMSISIVDCKQYPTYYSKIGEKSNAKSDNSSVEIDNKCQPDSEDKLNSADAQNDVVNTAITVHEADNKLEDEKKRRGPRSNSFFEKLNNRKENRKQIALNCKDLSQVDFKRNTGLVGLKITDTMFKQVVNTEKSLIRMKNQAEIKSKESNDNVKEKTLVPKRNSEEKCKGTFESDVEMGLSVVKNIENKSKENKQSNTEKRPVVTKSADTTKDQFNEKTESVVDNVFIGIQSKRNTEKDGEKSLIKTSIISAKDKSKEKSESNMYMKQVGAVLDNLGTTIIPITDRPTNNDATNNITVTDCNGNESVKAYKNSGAGIEKLRNNHDIEMRCSLKIPSKKIVEKVLKLKEVKAQSAPDVSKKTIVQQSPKETVTKTQAVPKPNTKSRKRDINGSCVISEKDELQCKRTGTPVTYSRETKRVEKPVAKYTNRKNQAGSNSPVIPCTTITVRAGPPKSTQNIPSPKDTAQSLKQENSSTAHISPLTTSMKKSLSPVNIIEPRNTSNDAQKLSQLPKVAMLNQADLSNDSKYTDNPKALPIITQINVTANSDTKDNSTSNLKPLKITEFKPPNNYPFATRLIDIKQNIPVPKSIEQNMSKTDLTKETNQGNTAIKSVTFSGNTVQVHIKNQTTNTTTNLEMTPPANPEFSGYNAIIFRKPTPPHSRAIPNSAPPNQGQPIQTVINHRLQYQPMPHGPTPMRFRLPPPYPPPPPNYPPPNYSSPPSNLAQIRQYHLFIPPGRMAPAHLRGLGLNNLRFTAPHPPGCRTPLPVLPRQDNLQNNLGPPSPQVNKDILIGNTSIGDPIKKINAPPATETVNDKQMMLAELNSAMMSPELKDKPKEKPCNLKRKADPKPIAPVNPKYSKPCPLSKKMNVTIDLNKKMPDKSLPKFGYSPPILPIWTYEESFQIFAKNTNIKKCGSSTQNRTPSKMKCGANIIKVDGKKHKTHTDRKQDKAKKISFDDYRKREKVGADRIDADKIRNHKKSKKVDDYNLDQGYDSDSTVKL